MSPQVIAIQNVNKVVSMIMDNLGTPKAHISEAYLRRMILDGVAQPLLDIINKKQEA